METTRTSDIVPTETNYSHLHTCQWGKAWAGRILQGNMTLSDRGCRCHQPCLPGSSTLRGTPRKLIDPWSCRSTPAGTSCRRWRGRSEFPGEPQPCTLEGMTRSCCFPPGSSLGSGRGLGYRWHWGSSSQASRLGVCRWYRCSSGQGGSQSLLRPLLDTRTSPCMECPARTTSRLHKPQPHTLNSSFGAKLTQMIKRAFQTNAKDMNKHLWVGEGGGCGG